MTRDEIQEKVDDLRYKIQKHGSLGYYIALALISFGIVFFLSSNLLFNKEASLTSTPLNKIMSINNVEFKVTNREFNPNNNLIQFNVKVKNLDLDGGNDLYVELREKQNPMEVIPTKLVKVSNEDFIVYATLPKKWSAVSLKFIDKSVTEGTKNYVKFYSDSKDITEDDTLREKNKDGLTIELVNNDIKNLNKEVEKIDTEISNKNKEIENLNARITSLEGEKEYQTETEVTTTDASITSIKGEIENKTKDIDSLKNKKKEINNKIDKLNKKKNDLNDLVK